MARRGAPPPGPEATLSEREGWLRGQLEHGGHSAETNARIGEALRALAEVRGDLGSSPRGEEAGHTLLLDDHRSSQGGEQRGHDETKYFSSGHQFLSWITHRPGVRAILAASPLHAPPGQVRGPHSGNVPQAVKEAIAASPPVQAVPEGEERQKVQEFFEEGWAMAEDYGAECEFDVDADSPGAE